MTRVAALLSSGRGSGLTFLSWRAVHLLKYERGVGRRAPGRAGNQGLDRIVGEGTPDKVRLPVVLTPESHREDVVEKRLHRDVRDRFDGVVHGSSEVA